MLKKTNLSGSIWDHQAGITYPAQADTVQRAAAAYFPQQKPLPCLALFQHFRVSPPQGGSTPSCPSRVRAFLPLGVYLALSPCCVPWAGGWQCWTQPGAKVGSCSTLRALSTPFSHAHCRAKGCPAVPRGCKALGARAWVWSSAAEAPGVLSHLEKGV